MCKFQTLTCVCPLKRVQWCAHAFSIWQGYFCQNNNNIQVESIFRFQWFEKYENARTINIYRNIFSDSSVLLTAHTLNRIKCDDGYWPYILLLHVYRYENNIYDANYFSTISISFNVQKLLFMCNVSST